ncbi:MAG: GTP cyclohydrolase I FolE [Proteobacteria bacterium SG_bin9]|nr:MAG: GTP cyclohydrolase I FolE [Proteobacteria bacterium SG_bin9]
MRFERNRLLECVETTARTANRPTRAEAEAAVRTLIRWAGDDPSREGLAATPARVARAYEEWFAGYDQKPDEILARTFGETGGYNELILMRDIPVRSCCEHHMAAIHGVAHIAYLPQDRVVGISKLARLVDAFGKRLQIQERLTSEIADTLDRVLQPLGVAVIIEAAHDCMASRGVSKQGATLVTRQFTGVFQEAGRRREVLEALKA